MNGLFYALKGFFEGVFTLVEISGGFPNILFSAIGVALLIYWLKEMKGQKELYS